MEFLVSVEVLAPLLKKLLVVVSKKSDLKTYKALRIHTPRPGSVGFYVYSKLTVAEGQIDADSSYGFDCGVDAELFEQVVKSLPKDKTAKITMDDTYVTLSTGGRSSYKFHIISPEVFMPLRDYETMPFIDIDFKKFIEGIRRVSFCYDPNSQKTVYQAVCINSEHFVATNGFCLSLFPNTILKVPGEILLPGRGVDQLEKLYAGAGEKGKFLCTGSELHLSCGGVLSSTRLQVGQYVGYKSILPISRCSKVILDRADLAKKVERVMLLASANKTIQMSMQDALFGKELLLHAKNNQAGDATDGLQVDLTGEFDKIAVNGETLLEILKNYDCEKITFEYRGHDAVFIITNGEHINAIQPVRNDV